MTKVAVVPISLILLGLVWLAMVAPATKMAVERPIAVAPSYEEIRWGTHAFEKHGADARRAIDTLRACGNNGYVYLCNGGEVKESYYVYICQFPDKPGFCAGAIVGRFAKGFTAYPSQCSWWFEKVENCRQATLR